MNNKKEASKIAIGVDFAKTMSKTKKSIDFIRCQDVSLEVRVEMKTITCSRNNSEILDLFGNP